MIRAAISSLSRLDVADEAAQISCGCSQDWYSDEWQRRAGCGPSTFTNVLWYTGRRAADAESTGKPGFIALMENVWEFVTPGERGIPSTEKLVSGITAYTQRHGLDITTCELQIPETRDERPGLPAVIDFIAATLAVDLPVAFLSLDKGEEENLDTWHWVTLVSIEYNDEKAEAFIEVLDNGKRLRADLKLWYNTTGRGGGFVGFSKA